MKTPRIRLYDLNEIPKEFKPFLEKALEETKKSGYGIRHGAVIALKNGRSSKDKTFWIAGHNGANGNSFFRHLYYKIYPGRTLHAEFAALAKVPCGNVLKILKFKSGIDVLRGARIYSYRVNHSGLPANSRPCRQICWPTLKSLGFKDAVYILKIDDTPYIAHEYF